MPWAFETRHYFRPTHLSMSPRKPKGAGWTEFAVWPQNAVFHEAAPYEWHHIQRMDRGKWAGYYRLWVKGERVALEAIDG